MKIGRLKVYYYGNTERLNKAVIQKTSLKRVKSPDVLRRRDRKKDVFEKSHDSVSPRELPIEKSYYKSIVYKTAAVMLLVVKIRDRLRFIRKLFRYVGDKLYAKAALTLVNRLVTPRIPVVKDLIPFYYAKKNFWKFALLYGLKKISDKAPKAR
ncbi:hypothetical protein [Albatrosspox virus]|nr:hypothetical protein [Albatrosspox virus]QRM16292.1 hypothetical protein [Albatrosspox virus]